MKIAHLGLFLGIALFASSASADPPKPLGETLTGEARAEYESARILFNDGDNAGAAIKMQHAYDLSKDPRLLWNVAACEKRMRHYARVLPLVERYLAEATALSTPEQIAEAREVVATVRPFVTRVVVKTDPDGSTIKVDGAPLGTTPLATPILVDMGSRLLEVEREGYVPWRERRDFPGGSELVVDVHLEKETHQGRLVVVAGANDRIDVDGTPRGVGRIDERVPSGVHTVEVRAPGMRTRSQDVTVVDGATRSLDVALAPEASGGGKTWLWLGLGGAALATAGIVTAVVLSGRASTTASPQTGTIQPGVIELGRGWR